MGITVVVPGPADKQNNKLLRGQFSIAETAERNARLGHFPVAVRRRARANIHRLIVPSERVTP